MGDLEFDRGVPDDLPLQAGTQHPSRLQRPRHREIQWHEDVICKQQSCPPQPKLRRQASKGRILGMFTRTKSTKGARASKEHEWDGDGARIGQDGQLPATVLRSFSQNDSDGAAVDSLLPEEPIKQQPLTTKRSKSFRRDPSSAKPIPWDPPPLFQAYPQAIKHTTVAAPAMSADAILRYQSDKKRRTKKKDTTRDPEKGDIMNPDEDKTTDDSENHPQLGQWSPKIYLLVTSGYFLQYAGEGDFDRLPEKIMPIGKESAAFASDAVPGKHWVLQVSHSSDENGTPRIENSWSFFKKFGMGGDMRRCSASNFLLVLDSPKDLDSWLGVVRKEIESWGGARYHHVATARPSDEEAALVLQQTSSRLYKVKRDPNQFSNEAQEASNSSGEATADDVPSLSGRKFSTTTQHSTHYSPSTSNETTSTDQNHLDRLRTSPRTSYNSPGAKTHSTSRESSPVPSPAKPLFQLSEFNFGHEPWTLDGRLGTSSGQTSTQMYSQKPLEHTLCPTVSRPSSTGKNSRAPSSGGAPNFSVPTFSTRFSTAHSTPPLSATSSSGSGNLPRKSMSPPAINEKYDAPPDVMSSTVDLEGQMSRASMATAAQEKEDDLTQNDIFESARANMIARPSTADRKVPRRFSSLEYSRGISPSNRSSTPSASPHPPPTSALPALPECTDNTATTAARKLRRPISMQVHSCPSASNPATSQPLPTLASPDTDDPAVYLPPPSRPPPPPPTTQDDSSSLQAAAHQTFVRQLEEVRRKAIASWLGSDDPKLDRMN
ncbi:MAG: hypothetical protein Q9169_004234 [Polycauliona sp. 2 TL-2023]